MVHVRARFNYLQWKAGLTVFGAQMTSLHETVIFDDGAVQSCLLVSLGNEWISKSSVRTLRVQNPPCIRLFSEGFLLRLSWL